MTSSDAAARIAALEAQVAELAAELEAARAGPGTWLPPGHYYSPIPDVEQLRPQFEQIFFRHRGELPGIDMNFERQQSLMQAFLPYYAEQPFSSQETPERRYHFENDQYSYADGLFLYFVLRHVRPNRVVEVGTGWSTCAMLDVDELFLDGDLAITSIDPDPQRLRARMRPGDERRVSIIEQPVQAVALETFDALGSGDILFIDSTHVLKTGSDVNHLLFEVLPRVASGVWVHIHDIPWPFEYAQEWVEEGRA